MPLVRYFGLVLVCWFGWFDSDWLGVAWFSLCLVWFGLVWVDFRYGNLDQKTRRNQRRWKGVRAEGEKAPSMSARSERSFTCFMSKIACVRHNHEISRC